MNDLQRLAQIAIQQKESVLGSDRGGYSPSLHDLFRVQLLELGEKYKKGDARDAIFLLLYLHSYANGKETNDYYMWAFPTVKQIRKDTGIHGDRINKLCRILECEGLLFTKMVAWHGNPKKMYLPLFYSIDGAIPVNGAA